ncbi:MAG: MlaD family protein, partial [bacterium]
MSINFADFKIFGREYYQVTARFSNVTGLQEDTEVELLGIPVGRVKKITLSDYEPTVKLLIRNDIDLPEDTIASIRTQGLLGEQYIHLSPGGLPMNIAKDGSGEIQETESPIILEEVISKFIYGSTEEN